MSTVLIAIVSRMIAMPMSPVSWSVDSLRLSDKSASTESTRACGV